MIPYQLPSGKTIFIDSNYFLNMSDNDLKDLVANDNGFEINNPFYGSAIDIETEIPNLNDLLLLEVPDLQDIKEIDISEED